VLIPKLTIEWVESRSANKSASIHYENTLAMKKVTEYQPKILGWIAPRVTDLMGRWGFGEVKEFPRRSLNTENVKPNLQRQLAIGAITSHEFDGFWNTSIIPARYTLKNRDV